MASNKESVQQLLKIFSQSSFGQELPDKVAELEKLLDENIGRLENLEQVIHAKTPEEALEALSKISDKVAPLSDFFKNFKDGKSLFDCLPLNELEKQGLLNKEQKEAAEKIANTGKAFYHIYDKVKHSKGKDLPFDEIDDVLEDVAKQIPALENLKKHIPVAHLGNVGQLLKNVKKFRDDYNFYKDNVATMTEEQAKQCKDGLKAETVGLAVAGSAVAVGIGLATAVALSAPIPGVNIAMAGVAAAVVVGFMVYKIGHKMNKEVKNELTEGLVVTDRKSFQDRLVGGLKERTLNSVKKMLHFSAGATSKKPAVAAEPIQVTPTPPNSKPKLN